MNLGRKNNVHVGKINGERNYVQERFLLWKMRDIVDIANGITEEANDIPRFTEEFGSELILSNCTTTLKPTNSTFLTETFHTVLLSVKYARFPH